MVGGPSTSDDPPATDPGVPRDLEWPPPLMTSPSPRRRDPRMGARLRKTATAVGRFSGPPPQPFLYPLPPSPPPLLQGITGRAGGRPTSFNHGAEGERRQQRPMQSRNCVFCCFFFFCLRMQFAMASHAVRCHGRFSACMRHGHAQMQYRKCLFLFAVQIVWTCRAAHVRRRDRKSVV